MVITFSNIKGSTGGGGGATGGTVSGITLWSDETTKAYIDDALSGVTDVLSAYTKTEDFATINGSAITSGGNLVIEATPYTAGANIDITDHIISVTGITLPTKVSELVNDSGYITTADTQNFVTSGDVQTQINDSISGKADSSAVTAQISEVKQEIEAKIPSKVSDLQNDLNFASTGDVETQIDNAVSGKQDTLVSGTNIKTINNQSLLGSGNIEIQGGGETYSAGEGIGINADNIISVTGNYETIVELTQAEYDALTSYDKNTTYVITDAPAVNLSAYTPTSGFSTINGNVITEGGNIVIEATPYSAGTNIDITDHIISVTGITLPTSNTAFTNDAGYVTSGEVETQITNKDYPTKNWVQDSVNLAIESETARTESTYAKIGDIPSLDGYATTGWVESQGYLTEHQDISGKLDTSVFTAYTANTQTEIDNKQDASGMTEYATTAFTESTYAKIGDIPTKTSDLTNDSGFITDAALNGYATEQYVDNSVSGKVDNSALTQYYTSAQTDTAISNAVSGKLDTSAITAYSTTEEVENMITAATNGLASEEWVNNQGFLKEHQSLSAYSTTEQVQTLINTAKQEVENEIPDVSNFVTSGEVETQITNKGYITGYTETDPVFQASAASGISEQDISNWNAKLDSSALTPYYTSAQTDNAISNATSGKQDTLVSGVNIKTINNESLLGSGNIVIEGGSSIKNYQPLQVEFSPNYSFIDAYEISSIGTQQFYKRIAFDTINGNSIIHESDNDKVNWTIPTSTSALTNDSGYVTSGEVNTQIESKGYITGYTETDPVFMASAASGISTQDITNWNNKLDSSDLEPYYTSAQTDNAINNAVSGKADLSAVTAQISEVKQEIKAEIPTKVSSLENDLNFVNSGDVKTQVESYNYINSGQAQTQIDNSISGKLDTDIFTAYTASTQTELNNKQDASAMTAYATTAFTESTYLKEHQSLSAYSTTEQVQTLINTAKQEVENEIPDVSNFVTSAQVNTQIESKGYLTAYTETDPVFQASAASGITSQDITNWNGKQPSGDYALRSELPTVPTSNTAFTNDAGYVNSSEVETQITSKGYITGYTESDPVFQASAASGITSQNISNWDNKLDSSALNPYYTSAQTNTAISNAVSGKTDKVSVTASGSGYKFPKWNNQGCITGTSATAYQAFHNINGSNRTVYSDSSEALPTIYAPTSEGLAGQPLLSNGSGAPVWGAYKFQFISQSQYDALATKDSTTIYFIVNEN